MKTKEQAAAEYAAWALVAQICEDQKAAIHAFTTGINYCQRWIPIEEEPILHGHMGEILFLLEDGSFYLYDEYWEDKCPLVTHWRPINY
ncbi:MAG: hypothetical protein LBH06_00855 [Rikenellaceae bacterium]|jgi:hypothetical protein|nr:hypothetical protein [Rikenellaceae bacterium]